MGIRVICLYGAYILLFLSFKYDTYLQTSQTNFSAFKTKFILNFINNSSDAKYILKNSKTDA